VKTPKLRVVMALLLGGTFGVGIPLAFGGCVEAGEVLDANCPPFQDFPAVSAVLEQRCGTLDCHGDDARPLKIYGRIGLRATSPPEAGVDADQYFSGGSEPTTDVERELNYRSVCGLEPELMNQVTAGEAPAGDLTLVRKARLQERHKGGRVFDDGNAGDRCLVRWLENRYEPGAYNPVDCNTELGIGAP
jgi:hypothetical protein